MVDLVDRYSLVLHALIFLLLPQYMTSLYNLFSGSTTLRSNFTSQKRYVFFYLVYKLLLVQWLIKIVLLIDK